MQARLGLTSRPEDLGLPVLPPPDSIWLTSAGRQAADLDGVWLVPLTLPQTVGIGPAHHLPLLDALSAGGGALPWGGPGQAAVAREGKVERQRKWVVSSNPGNAQYRKSTKRGAKSPLDQSHQGSTPVIKYSCPRWKIAATLS